MHEEPETLCYHGRRSVDELIGAINAENATVAMVHKELSRLHLDRFVAMMTAAADDIRWRPSRLR